MKHPNLEAGDHWDMRQCADMDPEWFFPHKNQGVMWWQNEETKLAMQACRECPIKSACLEFAIENMEDGVWGGTTMAQRLEMRDRAHRAGKPYPYRPYHYSDYAPPRELEAV